MSCLQLYIGMICLPTTIKNLWLWWLFCRTAKTSSTQRKVQTYLTVPLLILCTTSTCMLSFKALFTLGVVQRNLCLKKATRKKNQILNGFFSYYLRILSSYRRASWCSNCTCARTVLMYLINYSILYRIYIKYMVTVLKYQRYWARVRKRDRRRGLPSLLPRYRPEPKYRWYFKTVIMYFVYPATLTIWHIFSCCFNSLVP